MENIPGHRDHHSDDHDQLIDRPGTSDRHHPGNVIAINPERVIGMTRNTDRHRPESPVSGGTPQTVSNVLFFPGNDVSRDGRLFSYFAFSEFGVINLQTGQIQNKFSRDPRMGSSNGSDLTPIFTPDNRGLAYVVHAGGADNLWVQPIDGKKGYQLTDFKSDETYDFKWSPLATSSPLLEATKKQMLY